MLSGTILTKEQDPEQYYEPVQASTDLVNQQLGEVIIIETEVGGLVTGIDNSRRYKSNLNISFMQAS